ncbi:MAG: LTA synthase family protein, partial [Candidatus Heimdallarchaeota archaeon]|nr:LTA synthase family protein [Candidatus Heimdallarchaeota archaeon]
GLNKAKVPFPGKINPRHPLNYAHRETRKKSLKNVIMVQVESLGKMMLFYEVSGKKIMPFLNSLIPQSVFFDNFVAQHSGGGSSDTELSTLLSLLPLRSHSGLRTADYAKVTSLLHMLKKHGYTTSAMHANHRQFYNRAFAYPHLGFDTFYSRRDYQGKAKGKQSKDIEFFKQSLDKILALPTPYFAYLITMQSHGPYKNYSEETRLKFQFEPHFTQTQIDYICTLHEVDQALDFFITQLDRLSILDQSIVLIFSDEFPSILTMKNEQFENIPLMIIDPSLDPRVETKLGSTLSIASTVTELLGISEADHWLGDSLLSSPEDRVVLFNNLTVIRREGSEIVAHKDVRYKKFVDYSRSILE